MKQRGNNVCTCPPLCYYIGPCKKYNSSYATYYVVVRCLVAAVDVFLDVDGGKKKGYVRMTWPWQGT